MWPQRPAPPTGHSRSRSRRDSAHDPLGHNRQGFDQRFRRGGLCVNRRILRSATWGFRTPICTVCDDQQSRCSGKQGPQTSSGPPAVSGWLSACPRAASPNETLRRHKLRALVIMSSWPWTMPRRPAATRIAQVSRPYWTVSASRRKLE